MPRGLGSFFGSIHSRIGMVGRSDRIVLGQRKKGNEGHQDPCILASVSTTLKNGRPSLTFEDI